MDLLIKLKLKLVLRKRERWVGFSKIVGKVGGEITFEKNLGCIWFAF